jgi:nucleoside-diphosphate-sugar epimerase
VYGPGQSTDFFVPSLVMSCLRGLEFEMSEGRQGRDLLYVDDLVEAVLLAATQPRLRGEMINLGHGIEHRIVDVAGEVVELVGAGRLLLGARPAEGLEHLVTRTDRAALLLGWRPAVPLRDGLSRTVQWYRDHLDP